MAFVKTKEYFDYRLKNVRRAIKDTHAKIRELCQDGMNTDVSLVDAQTSYLCSLEKHEAMIIDEWYKWHKKQEKKEARPAPKSAPKGTEEAQKLLTTAKG